MQVESRHWVPGVPGVHPVAEVSHPDAEYSPHLSLLAPCVWRIREILPVSPAHTYPVVGCGVGHRSHRLGVCEMGWYDKSLLFSQEKGVKRGTLADMCIFPPRGGLLLNWSTLGLE